MCSARHQVVQPAGKERSESVSIAEVVSILDDSLSTPLAVCGSVRELSSLFNSFNAAPWIRTSRWFSDICVGVVRRALISGAVAWGFCVSELPGVSSAVRQASVAEWALDTAEPVSGRPRPSTPSGVRQITSRVFVSVD